MSDMIKKNASRLLELDLLRGFFIFVIIVDHVQRWPSPLTYLTGEGRLWVSAAEGFFIISGLLIGYLRGFKGMKLPFRQISKLLIKRAALLYIWSVIITFIAVWLVAVFNGDPNLVPKLPEVTGLAYVWQVFTQQYVFDWIYFLRLYWMMLLAAPIAILLFRIRKWWLVPVISLTLYGLSFMSPEPEAALQWQVLFFIPATIGFHLDAIRNFFKTRQHLKNGIIATSVIIMIITMVISYFWVLGWNYVESGASNISRDSYVNTRGWLDPYFAKSPLAIGRVLLSFIWFGGLLAFFHAAKPFLLKWFGWLLLPFGQYSLTGYSVQAIVLLFIQFFVPASTNPLINLIIGLGSVILLWLLLRLRFIRAVFPQ